MVGHTPFRLAKYFLTAILLLSFCAPLARAQASLLMAEPYGLFGAVNPTGHTAIYFERICAETPTRLRRCEPGEPGAVLSRYQGISGYDWIAIPLIPYLYAINDLSEFPHTVNREEVTRLRERYHEQHLLVLGEHLPPGDFFHGGWTQLAGVSYERRIYAFRFMTSEAQDDALITWLNDQPNHSDFSLLSNNCADFARRILNFYFPRTFHRSIFPDAGMTTPRQIAWKLTRLGRRNPSMQLSIFEIPQIPGFRRSSHSNKSVSESLATTAWAVPIVLVNPWLAGGIAVDYLARGRYTILPRHPQQLTPETLMDINLSSLTRPAGQVENPTSAAVQAPGATQAQATQTPAVAHSGLMEIVADHEGYNSEPEKSRQF